MKLRNVMIGTALLVGCDRETGGAPDARPADAVVGVDAGPCGANAWPFEATIEELDSTEDSPLPIVGVSLTVQGGGATTTTDATGAFTLCLSNLPARITIDAPDDYLDGVMYVEATYLRATTPIRLFTSERATTFYAERGLTFDSGLGQLLALQAADGGQLTLEATHDAAQTTYGSDESYIWVAGNDGRYVLFANTDVASATVRLNESASLDPPELGRRYHDVPIAAGTLTFAIVSLVYGP